MGRERDGPADSLHGREAVAQLKLAAVDRRGRDRGRLHGRETVAQLKRSTTTRWCSTTLSSPRPRNRGSIEAAPSACIGRATGRRLHGREAVAQLKPASLRRGGHPRGHLHGREAVAPLKQSARTCGARPHHEFPRRRTRGSIEALSLASSKGQAVY